MDFLKYASTHNCSVAQAIADRDWPLTRDECAKEFLDVTGKMPTQDEMWEMRPDQDEAVSEYRRQEMDDLGYTYNC